MLTSIENQVFLADNQNSKIILVNEKIVRNSNSQSAAKTLTLLRHIGVHTSSGLRLTDLIELTGFDRSTAHRLLLCLLEEGFVERIPDTKRYRLGLESIQLGLSATDMASVIDLFAPLLRRLARQTGDTVFLMVRSGDYALYVGREEGSFPVRALLVETGMRRLLGLSTVGVSIMAALPDEEAQGIYYRHEEAYRKRGVLWERLSALMEEVRVSGFSQQSFLMKEVYGVGCSIRISPTLQAGVSIAAIRSRMNSRRRDQFGQILKQELEPLIWQPESTTGTALPR